MAYVVETDYFVKGAKTSQKILTQEGDSYSGTYPNKVFLVIVADESGNPGNFDISFSYEDLDGEAIKKQK